MAEVGEEKQLPLLVLAQDLHAFSLLLKDKSSSSSSNESIALKEKILLALREDRMVDQYVAISSTFGWEIDENLVKSMR